VLLTSGPQLSATQGVGSTRRGKKREGKREGVGPSGQTESGRDFAIFFPFFIPNPFSKITLKYF